MSEISDIARKLMKPHFGEFIVLHQFGGYANRRTHCIVEYRASYKGKLDDFMSYIVFDDLNKEYVTPAYSNFDAALLRSLALRNVAHKPSDAQAAYHASKLLDIKYG